MLTQLFGSAGLGAVADLDNNVHGPILAIVCIQVLINFLINTRRSACVGGQFFLNKTVDASVMQMSQTLTAYAGCLTE